MPDQKEKSLALFIEIKKGNKLAFNDLFLMYHPKLIAFAKQYVRNQESAEEITSELFVKIWIKRESLNYILNPEVYLFVSIKNACLNLIRSDSKRRQHLLDDFNDQQLEKIADPHYHNLEQKELKTILNHVVDQLPEQRKIIFKLIKEEGLKGSAVAEILGISVRTVENQLYKAVKTIAESMTSYLNYDPQKKTARKQVLSMLM